MPCQNARRDNPYRRALHVDPREVEASQCVHFREGHTTAILRLGTCRSRMTPVSFVFWGQEYTHTHCQLHRLCKEHRAT
jgi:hypothetical protein